MNHYLIRLFPQFWLYKSQKMFLIHACWVMDMCINLPDIIKVTVWGTFLCKELSVRIKHNMKIEFLIGNQIRIMSSSQKKQNKIEEEK